MPLSPMPDQLSERVTAIPAEALLTGAITPTTAATTPILRPFIPERSADFTLKVVLLGP